MANNPFAPTAPTAPTAPIDAAEAVDTPVDAESKKRKRNAKSMNVEQHKEIITRSKNGETPNEAATAMGLERNQVYNFVRKYKKVLQSMIEGDDATVEQKAKAQTELDAFPVREFGATAGEKRTSSSAVAINDLLAEAGLSL